MTVHELVIVWEDAYRRYQGSAGPNVVVTSRAVAMAWRALATVGDLPWWLHAAVESAAAAFERQAEEWEAGAARERLATPPKRVCRFLGMGDSEETGLVIPESRKPCDAVAVSPVFGSGLDSPVTSEVRTV